MISEDERQKASATIDQHRALVKGCLRSIYLACLHGQRPQEMHLAALPAACELLDDAARQRPTLDEDEPERAPPKSRDSKPKAKPANACTDGKRHKYGEDRKCGKCGAADPRAPKPDTRTAEIPGVA